MSLSANFPTIRPSLALDFASSRSLDPRITFTRASTATYYDDHTVAKADENLLLYSQDFDNAAWVRVSSTITANATAAPDGTTTADLLIPEAANAAKSIRQAFNVTSGFTYAYSIYVKAGGYNFFQIANSTGFLLTSYTNFNLSTGAIGNTTGDMNASIVSVGNGWYRCSVVVNATSTGSAQFLSTALTADTASRSPSFAGDGTSGVFIWGAQLEQRSSVTAYTPTTTQAITNYVPQLLTAASGVARFEHNPVTRESLGLEIEESRTNLVLRSDDFSLWNQVNGSAQSNVIVAPDGTLTADKFVANTTFGQHRVEQTFSLTSGTAYTISVYAKAAECSRVALRVANDSANANFDLITGTVSGLLSGSNATITPAGNGWYRCAVTGTATVTGSAVNARINVYSPAGANDWTGNDWNGLYIWGAQVEAGSFATSYIPTVASQVTRSADAAIMTGTNFSSWYRADEGAFYSEANFTNTVSFNTVYSAEDGTTSNQIRTIQWNNGNSRPLLVVAGNTTQATLSATARIGSTKFAAAYKADDFAASQDGATALSDSSGAVPVVNRLSIGCTNGNSFFLSGHIRKIAYYPARLTNAQLQALTTV